MTDRKRSDAAPKRKRDPVNDVFVGDDAGGMPAEFIDSPENEPGDHEPPTVVDRTREMRDGGC